MSAINAPDLPEPRLAGLQAVFRFASLGRGDPALDDVLYDRVRVHLPLRLVQRPAVEPSPQSPHLVFSSNTAQMAVGVAQADLVMQLDAPPADLTLLTGDLLEAVRLGLEAGGIRLATMGLITTMQISTQNIGGFSPQEHIFTHHMQIQRTDPEQVQDLSVALNVKVADRFFVGVNLSAYETRQIVQPVLPGVATFPVALNPWEGVLMDVGLQLRSDVNNQLDARLRGTDQVSVTEDVLSSILLLTQTVVGDLAQNFISNAILPVDALEGALNE